MAEKLQTIKEIRRIIIQMFSALYPAEEARAVASVIIEEYTGKSRVHQMTDGESLISMTGEKAVTEAAERVAAGEPLQYVLGYTLFYGHRFNVNPAVLIPRPETEEMTSLIAMENEGFEGTVIDFCTGSGCIAVSLALAFPEATVHATDISPEAIETATQNASANDAVIHFIVSDIFNTAPDEYPLAGIIVSNPPYVRESEKKQMRRNVLEHEPSQALFVSDADPFLFYRMLEQIARCRLLSGGSIYMEINEALGSATRALFENGYYEDLRLIKDIRGKDRILTARRNGRKE